MAAAIFETHSQGIQRAYRAAERAAGEDREPGREAFSSWRAKGFKWSEEDYDTPGFQECYIKSNFVKRAKALYDVLHGLREESPFVNYTSQQELLALDFSGGPGCLADGTSQFLKELGIASSTLTIFDPVTRWSVAVDYLHQQDDDSSRFDLQQKDDLFEMATSAEVGRANIITIGSALVDFLDKSLAKKFWEEIARQVVRNESQAIVFVFDRFKGMEGEWLFRLPHVRPHPLGDKQGGLYPYAVYINFPGHVPRPFREMHTPAPSTPVPTRRQGATMTPEPVHRQTGDQSSSSSEAHS